MIAFTTARLELRRTLRTCVFFRAGEFGLTADCVTQCETLASIPVSQLENVPIGRLDKLTLRSVTQAIGEVISADCEPN